MDFDKIKATLIEELGKVNNSFTQEGKPLDFLGIAPLYPEMPSTSYVVQVHASWLDGIPNCNEALKIVIDKLYGLVAPKTLRYINRVDICYSDGEVHCTSNNIIINNREFALPSKLYNFADLD